MTTRRRRSGPRRQNMWLPFYFEGLTVSAGGTISTGNLLARYQTEVGREVPIGTTIGPIIGNLSVLGDTVGLAPDLFGGIELIREGQSVTVVDLELEPADLIWMGTHMGLSTVMETAAGVFAVEREPWHVETHAMRKTRSVGDEMFLKVDEVSGDAGASMSVAFHLFLRFP